MTIPFAPEQWQAIQQRAPFEPVYNLDRFGFRRMLARQCDVSPERRVYCDWMHGWIWWEAGFDVDDFPGPKVPPQKLKIVTATAKQAQVLRQAGHDAIAGGLPFCYVPPSGYSRRPDTLLAFPTHSSDRYRNRVVQEEYYDFLADQRDRFEIVCVSLFIHDYRPEIIDKIRKRGLIPVIGADPLDAHSLWRSRATLDLFSHVSTNAFGSHVAYALASGCTVSIHSPVVVNDPRPRAKDLHLSDAHVSKKEMVQSEPWLIQHFPKLMHADPKNGLKDGDLGAEYIGKTQKLDPDGICAAVGWDLTSSLIGATRRALHAPSVILRRLKRKRC